MAGNSMTMTLRLVGSVARHWEFHGHGTLKLVGDDGALGVSKSMHYETLFIKKSLMVQRLE
jgi:hypothetical protein